MPHHSTAINQLLYVHTTWYGKTYDHAFLTEYIPLKSPAIRGQSRGFARPNATLTMEIALDIVSRPVYAR
jgi:hypothetical protein